MVFLLNVFHKLLPADQAGSASVMRIQQSKTGKRLLDQSPIEKLSAPRYFALERNELNRY